MLLCTPMWWKAYNTKYKPIVNYNGEKSENSLFYVAMASNVLSAIVTF